MENRIEISEEIEINIVQFGIELFRRWKTLLVVCVVFAVLLGGCKYYTDVKEAKAKNEKRNQTTEMRAEELSKNMDDEEIRAVKAAVSMHNFIDKADNYMYESLFMSVNPYDERQVVCTFFIDVRDLTDTDKEKLHDAYNTYVKSFPFAEKLKEKMNWKYDARYISELITADDKFTVYSDGAAGLATSNIFHVNIINPNDTDYTEIAAAVQEIMKDYEPLQGSYHGKYKLESMDATERAWVDKTSIDAQSGFRGSLKSRRTDLDNMEKELSASGQKLYELYTAEEESEEEKAALVHASVSPKFLILGVIVGLFAYAAYLFAMYALKPVISPVTNAYKLIPDRYAGRLAANTANLSEVAASIDFKRKNSANPEDEIKYFYWSDMTEAHKKSLAALAGSASTVELPADNKDEAFKFFDGRQNVVLVAEDEGTPLARFRDVISIVNDSKSNLIAYTDFE